MDALAEQETNAFVRRLHRVLVDASSSADDTGRALTVLHSVIAADSRPRADAVALLPPCAAAAASDPAQWAAWRAAFVDRHYAGLLDSATALLADAGRVQALPTGAARQRLDELYLDGPPIDAFCALADLVPLSSRRGPYVAGKAALLLEEFIVRRRGVAAALRSRAVGHCSLDGGGGSLAVDGFASRLASLPDHAANRFERETSRALLPAAYVDIVAEDIITTLRDVREELAAGRDCTLVLVAAVVGKLCITGRAEQLCSRLLPAALQQSDCQSDFIWIRVWHRLIVSIPSRMQENFLVQLFLHVRWYKSFEHLLGNTILENHSLRHLITNKLLFHKVFREAHILQNIIGYLATSPSRHKLFIEVLHNLLDVWCDSSCIKRSSYEQHSYISRALIVCFSFLSDQDKIGHHQAVLGKLMNGVQEHIGSNSVAVRRLGMIVAELGTECLNATAARQGSATTDSEYQLKFEYEQDDEVDELRALARAPLEPSPSGHSDTEALAEAPACAASSKSTSVCPSDATRTGDAQQPANGNTQLDAAIDSDDDLEPYDMSADKPKTKVATPAYIRDCMEGLVSSEEPERVQVSLAVSAQLIKSSATGVREVAAEFCKILLHLSNNFSLTEYEASRHSAMVALLVTAPVETAGYLTGEMCARNYTVKQRLDILEALSAGAQELSQILPSAEVSGQAAGGSNNALRGSSRPDGSSTATRDGASSVSHAALASNEVHHWTQIVDDRIKAKTRVFARGPRQPPAIAAANRFAPVAGNFFFPLLVNMIRRTEESFDLLSEDNTMVLVKFIVTLAKVMLAASNAPISVKMGRHLLDFIWNLRYHSDRSVRMALLFAVIAVFLALPTHLMMQDFVEDVTEFMAWLDDLDSREADPECRKMVGRAMQVLQQRTQAAMRIDAEKNS